MLFSDFQTLVTNVYTQGGWTNGDFDLNGAIELADFLMLSDNFGAKVASTAAAEAGLAFAAMSGSGTASAIPEPSSWVLAWFTFGWMFHRARRRRAPNCG